ncbi:hypothetical protein PR003_g28346, partial [Phytophthora rubi]
IQGLLIQVTFKVYSGRWEVARTSPQLCRDEDASVLLLREGLVLQAACVRGSENKRLATREAAAFGPVGDKHALQHVQEAWDDLGHRRAANSDEEGPVGDGNVRRAV